MAGTPLRELFVEFFGTFDHTGFDQANEATNSLEENLTNLGGSTDDTGDKATGLTGHLQELETVLSNSGVSTGRLGTLITALGSPITLALGAVVALSAAFAAWLYVLQRVSNEIYQFVSSMAEVGAQINNVASRIGIATESLVAFRQAAAESGAGADTFDRAVTDLSSHIGEALQNRASQSARLFRQLGISISNSADPANQLQDVLFGLADAMHGTRSQAERVRIANQLMGEAGRQLVPVFQQGSDALRGFIAEQEAAQPGFQEYLHNSALVTIQQARLNQAWEGAKQTVFNIFAPAVIVVINVLTRLILWYNRTREAQIALQISVAVLAASFVGLGIAITGTLLIAIGALITLFPPLIGYFTLLAALFGTIIGTTISLTLAFQDFYVFLAGGDSVFGRFINGLNNMVNSLVGFAHELISTEGPLGTFIHNLSDTIDRLIDAYNAVAEFAGLPTIEFDLRTALDTAIPAARTEEQQRAYNEQFQQRIRSDINGLLAETFGVGVNPNGTLIPITQQIENFANTGTPSGNIPALASGGSESLSPSARVATSTTPTTISVTQTIPVTINEATDGAAINQTIQDAINSANRGVADLYGTD